MRRQRTGTGDLMIVLHAHLPFIRYPQHAHHLEERWLYEAITETYVPLLDLCGRLLHDGTDFRLTLSITPTLSEMLQDSLLMARYERHLESLIELADKEVSRTRLDRRFSPPARMYRDRFRTVRRLYREVYGGDLVSAFGALMDSGKVEIIASAATHAYLPALVSEPSAVRAQVLLGGRHFDETFGRRPSGMWLPECGYTPELDRFLGEAGIRFFFLESHGILNSKPRPARGIYAPVRTPSGIVAFARDAEASRQVWSSVHGYPGDFDYRDFYRDIGYDLEETYIGPYLPGGIRTFTGLKYYRITGITDRKKPYVRARAIRKTSLHAHHFLESRAAQMRLVGRRIGCRPLVTAAYDAELFGHWWFEGIEWLESVFRMGAAGKQPFRFVTPSEYLAETGDPEVAVPSASSWGRRGYHETWINSSNSWMHACLRRAERTMTMLCRENFRARGLTRKALNQAARELLIAQASDWAFMIQGGNAAEFAAAKFQGHLRTFYSLARDISQGKVHASRLARVEQLNPIFPFIDFRLFAGDHGDAAAHRSAPKTFPAGSRGASRGVSRRGRTSGR